MRHWQKFLHGTLHTLHYTCLQLVLHELSLFPNIGKSSPDFILPPYNCRTCYSKENLWCEFFFKKWLKKKKKYLCTNALLKLMITLYITFVIFGSCYSLQCKKKKDLYILLFVCNFLISKLIFENYFIFYVLMHLWSKQSNIHHMNTYF